MKLHSNCGILCQNYKRNDECLQNVFLELQNILLQVQVHQCLFNLFSQLPESKPAQKQRKSPACPTPYSFVPVCSPGNRGLTK